MVTNSRVLQIDAARGGLLASLAITSVVAVHGSANQIACQQNWVGVFLIGATFAALSGVASGGISPDGIPTNRLRAILSSFHLLLVMVFYTLLLSLAHQALAPVAGGSVCNEHFAWTPPVRFEALGLLAPLVIIELLAPLARWRARLTVPGLAFLALACILLPAAATTTHWDGVRGAVLGVLALRTWTPYHDVGYLLAFGLVFALLARWPPRPPWELRVGRWSSAAALVLAGGMAIPWCSHAALDPAYRGLGRLGGPIAMLAYWAIAVTAFLHGFSSKSTWMAWLRRRLELLGRNWLLVLVALPFLLELNAVARVWVRLGPGTGVITLLLAVDLAVLLALCNMVERQPQVRYVASLLLLDRIPGRLPAPAPMSLLYGGLAVISVLSVYSGYALARPDSEQVIDDFEGADACPEWWDFGSLHFRRVGGPSPVGAAEPYLEIRGAAPGTLPHGCGLFLQRDLGSRRTLVVDVRGYGPGSGRIKIELDEDDNGNWEIETDPRTHAPLYDDRFVNQFEVDWVGWRELRLPLSAFRDDNPAVGNNVFDPARGGRSGGLLELQLLFSPTTLRSDEIRIDLANLRWAP